MPSSAIVGSEVDEIAPKTALVSVSDKSGLADLGVFLELHNIKILSTGGTAKALRDAGVEVTDVSEYTSFPEIEDGRVKTLHPKIHGGILGVRGNKAHEEEMTHHGIDHIDIVIANLYPFVETVKKGLDFAMCIENIDIGGPSMIRSAAKNHKAVAVLTSPEQYQKFKEEMTALNGKTCHQSRRRWAAEAFATTAEYDASISSWFTGQLSQ